MKLTFNVLDKGAHSAPSFLLGYDEIPQSLWKRRIVPTTRFIDFDGGYAIFLEDLCITNKTVFEFFANSSYAKRSLQASPTKEMLEFIGCDYFEAYVDSSYCWVITLFKDRERKDPCKSQVYFPMI